MSQHVTNHSFGGSDSLLAKWNGLIGKGVREKKSILGSVSCFCKCRSNLHPIWWVVIRLEKVAVDPVKADTCSCREKTLEIPSVA